MPWPPDHLLSLTALAQHYGVPTRLLDWTWSPYIAAYFAASTVARGAASVCVWAFSVVNREIQELLIKREDRRLQLVSAPAGDNENLRAQRWVGLVYRHLAANMQEPFIHRSYDELADDSFGSTPIFWKLTLPSHEAGELLRLLSTLDVDSSTVFPGFNGAAKAVSEMSRWPSQKEWRSSGRPNLYWAQHEALCERQLRDRGARRGSSDK
jgi:hypothetical protein